MIVDTSAVVALVRAERLADAITRQIYAAGGCRISAANLFEVFMVIDRSDSSAADAELDRFLTTIRPVVEPVTAEQVAIARIAFHRYGKGSGHPAGLNFGDCFAYALARFHDEPLLFVGHDFAATDIVPALPSLGG